MAFKRRSGTALSSGSGAAVNFFTALNTFITDTQAAGGLEWSTVWSGTGQNGYSAAVYLSTGESGSEEVRAGVSVSKNGSAQVGVQFNAYRGHAVGKCFHDDSGSINSSVSSLGYYVNLPTTKFADNSDATYWLIGRKDYVAGVVFSGTQYFPFYLGLAKRNALAAQDPYPMIARGAFYGSTPQTTCFTGSQKGLGDAHNAAISNSKDYMWGGATWCKFGGCLNPSATVVGAGLGVYFTYPSSWEYSSCLQPGNYYVLLPMALASEDGDRGVFWDVYKVHGAGLTAEDTIVVGGNNYKVFPDSISTDQKAWYAIRDYN